MTSVYTAVNTHTGAIYIGMANDVASRWKVHVSSAPKTNTPLSRSIMESGAEAFSVSVVSAHTSRSDAAKAERALISLYEDSPFLLNVMVPVYVWEDFLTDAERVEIPQLEAEYMSLKRKITEVQSVKENIRRKAVQRARNDLNKQARAAMKEKGNV